jgi:hypothetical protein
VLFRAPGACSSRRRLFARGVSSAGEDPLGRVRAAGIALPADADRARARPAWTRRHRGLRAAVAADVHRARLRVPPGSRAGAADGRLRSRLTRRRPPGKVRLARRVRARALRRHSGSSRTAVSTPSWWTRSSPARSSRPRPRMSRRFRTCTGGWTSRAPTSRSGTTSGTAKASPAARSPPGGTSSDRWSGLGPERRPMHEHRWYRCSASLTLVLGLPELVHPRGDLPQYVRRIGATR